jgi:2-isopropylmalate synthase
MTKDEKLRIAKQLERLKVDVIEAGFAAASVGDFQAVEQIAQQIKESTVCSLARANMRDIEQAGLALKAAERRRIHTFIATSKLHMEKKLNKTPDEVFDLAVQAVVKARHFTDDVEFSCEDASRSDLDFMARVIEAVIKAGATTINIPDTVGFGLPVIQEGGYGYLLQQLIHKVPNSDQAIWSVHCHNDLGMAVANSLSGVLAGARQIECSINGLGERAGNAALEEVVMALKTRHHFFGFDVNVDTTQLVPSSKLVTAITGFNVQPNKAIVGANAFSHASGIHQDGVLKNRDTYEIMSAQDVGWNNNKIILGKLSGRSALKQRLLDLGYEFKSESELNETFTRFKSLADRKAEVFDEDLHALMNDATYHDEHNDEVDAYELVALKQQSEMGERPFASLSFKLKQQEIHAQAHGNGAVDAVVQAIESSVKSEAKLLLFSVNAITNGTQSQGEVTMRLEKNGRIVNGVATDPDIVIASAKAYLNALSRLQYQAEKMNPQQS